MTQNNTKLLEENYTRLELMLEELNTVITRQDKEILILSRKIELLMVRGRNESKKILALFCLPT